MVTCDLQIRHVRSDELAVAGAVVGRALRDTPGHLRFFSANPGKRAGAVGEVYAVVLRQIAARGAVLGAFVDDVLAGVCAIAEPGCCQPTAMEKLAVGRMVAAHTSMGTALAFKRWQADIAVRDPEYPHWHLGPVAVEPVYQGQGIGGALLDEFTRMLEHGRGLAFLDTDQKDALGFFGRFGFREYTNAAIQGVPHWFMIRPRS
jgi:GNAT superfamily N-acetyltransferase